MLNNEYIKDVISNFREIDDKQIPYVVGNEAHITLTNIDLPEGFQVATRVFTDAIHFCSYVATVINQLPEVQIHFDPHVVHIQLRRYQIELLISDLSVIFANDENILLAEKLRSII